MAVTTATGPLTATLRVQPGGIEFQQLWAQVRVGCDAILQWFHPTGLRGRDMSKHVVELYTLVYRLASNPGRNVPGLVKGGSETVSGKDEQSTQVLVLYYLLRELLKGHLENRVKPAFQNLSGVEVLRVYEEQWKRYTVGVELLSFVFRYLHNHWNKQGLPPGHVTTSTKPLGMILWGDIVVTHLRTSLETELLTCIREDRERGLIQPKTTDLIRTVLSTFSQLSIHDSRRQAIFADVFENPYVRDTARHYSTAASASLQSGNIEQYVKDALRWTSEEMRRVERYTSERSSIPASIRRTLLSVLVEGRSTELFAPVDDLLRLGDPQSAARLGDLYQLIKPSETSVSMLAEKLQQRVSEDGQKSVATLASQETQGAEFVQVVLQVYRKFKELVASQLENNATVMRALRSGCKAFVNTNPHHKSDACAEHLARYANTILRPSQSQDDEVERLLRELVEIFDLFNDRDVFQTSYSILLCQRLIQQTMREEWEEMAIRLFRIEFGRDFTYKWERMLSDATTTKRSLREQYVRESTVPKPDTNCEFQALVLTSAWWPLKSVTNFVSVSIIGELQRSFESWYMSTIGGRRMTWLVQFSHGVAEARIQPSASTALYQLTVSAPQWELLNLLNQSDSVGFQQLKAVTQSSDTAVLQRAVFALLKYKILTLADSTERDVERQVYQLNLDFTHNQRRINLAALAQMAEVSSRGANPTEDTTQTMAPRATIHNERRFAIQAAIVRVMKARRTATYQDIHTDVDMMLRKNQFTVSPADLKTNLEVLIEKEFVERAPSDPNSFLYLAQPSLLSSHLPCMNQWVNITLEADGLV